MRPVQLHQPGDVVLADGQAWAVVARADSDRMEYADTADVTLRLRRLGQLVTMPVDDRKSTAMPRAMKLEAVPC